MLQKPRSRLCKTYLETKSKSRRSILYFTYRESPSISPIFNASRFFIRTERRNIEMLAVLCHAFLNNLWIDRHVTERVREIYTSARRLWSSHYKVRRVPLRDKSRHLNCTGRLSRAREHFAPTVDICSRDWS